MSKIVCYINKSGISTYRKISDSCSIEDFAKSENIPVSYVFFAFNEKDDLISHENEKREIFENYCESMGFRESDYGTEFKNNGHNFRFSGFNLRNKKYKCLLTDIDTGVIFKVTPEYVKSHIGFTKRIFVSKDSSEIDIEDYDTRISSYATIISEYDDNTVMLCIDNIDGDSNVNVICRKFYNQKDIEYIDER